MGAGVLTSLRTAASLSRLMRGTAERGAMGELTDQMAQREGLLADVAAGLAALERKEGLAPGDRQALAGMLTEFESENRLLIEALQVRQRQIVRCIAEAEGHRRLSAYAR